MTSTSSLSATNPASSVVARVSREHGLSARETEVLAAASEGKCIKEIAVEMGVSAKAVEYYWARIYVKLGCASQIEALAILLRSACAGPDLGNA